MLEFITLFLGLTSGPQMVQLEAGGSLAAVEVQLDGRVVDRVEQMPWEVEVDFGLGLNVSAND